MKFVPIAPVKMCGSKLSSRSVILCEKARGHLDRECAGRTKGGVWKFWPRA